MTKQIEKKQKSIWLMTKTWKVINRVARKRGKLPGSLVRDILEEWSEANK